MGSFGQALGQTFGQSGNDLQQARQNNTDRELNIALAKLQQQQIEQQMKVQQQEMQLRGAPKPQFFSSPGGGTAAVTTNQFTGAVSQPQTIVPGTEVPKTSEQAWLEAAVRENGGKPLSTQQIGQHIEQTKRNPVDQLLDQGNAAMQSGDLNTAQTYYKLASTVSGARKGPTGQNSLLSMISAANQGDPNAQAAVKTWLDMQRALAGARGAAFGAGRAMYQIGAYEDGDTGQIVPMSALDAISAIHSGHNLIPTGRLPATTAIAAQQLTSEAGPALKGVRSYLGSFDNPADRAIFARILSTNPAITPGQETQWLGQVLNQAATSELSPEGKHLVVNLNRLNESVGRLRSVLGLPATQSMTAMTLAMVPGPATPSSEFASDMLDNLEQTINNAISIPALGGAGRSAAGGSAPGTPPPGATIKVFDPKTGTVK